MYKGNYHTLKRKYLRNIRIYIVCLNRTEEGQGKGKNKEKDKNGDDELISKFNN